MKKHFISIALILISSLGLAQTQTVSPDNKMLVKEGRIVINGSKAEYVYPGTSFSINFIGTKISAILKNNAGYYWVEIDDNTPFKLSTHNINNNDEYQSYQLAENLKNEEHKATITLISEGLFVKPAFYGFETDEDAKLLKPEKSKLSIEFIGNSITCGYGVEAKGLDEHFADSTSNFCKTYAYYTAQNINAAKMVVARSGIGVYRNYADNPQGSLWPMSKVYFNTMITDTINKWDFSQFKADIICIGLGTNDMSTAGYDIEKFTLTYIKFVKEVRAANKNAKIILLNSAMLDGNAAMDLYNAANNVCNAMRIIGDAKVYRYDFTAQDGALGYGADSHPSAAQQRKMASQLTAFIKSNILQNKEK